MSDKHAPEVVEHASSLSFDSTVKRLTQTIMEHGMTIFATIDHAAGARKVGMSMPPATVLIYGNSKGGTPVMLAAPLAALDLPLRVLVREDEQKRVSFAFHPIAAALRDIGVTEDLAGRLVAAQTALVDGITS